MMMQIQVCFDVDVAGTLRFTTVLIVRSLDDFPLVCSSWAAFVRLCQAAVKAALRGVWCWAAPLNL